MWKDASSQGHVKAQSNLGVIYAKGEGAQQDYAEAAKWFRRSAEQGFAQVQCVLGGMYDNGQGGMQQDYNEAVKWYRKAAEQGDANALFNLGAMYKKGLGVQQKAVFWLERAASQDFNRAKLVLEQLRSHQVRAPSSDSPKSPSDAQSTCGHCAAQASSGTSLKFCSGCGIVACCSRDRQVSHWKAGHKKSCKARKST